MAPAAVVEMIILICLIGWELLRPDRADAASVLAVPEREEQEQLASSLVPPAKLRMVSNPAPAGSAHDYVLARIERSAGSEIEFAQTFADYEAWCTTRCVETLTLEQLAEGMKRICEKSGVRIRRMGKSAAFVGVNFASAPCPPMGHCAGA